MYLGQTEEERKRQLCRYKRCSNDCLAEELLTHLKGSQDLKKDALYLAIASRLYKMEQNNNQCYAQENHLDQEQHVKNNSETTTNETVADHMANLLQIIHVIHQRLNEGEELSKHDKDIVWDNLVEILKKDKK